MAEVNFGGEMVESTLRVIDPDVSYKAVLANRGKAVRAEPITALYEKGQIFHAGVFQELEAEICTWTPESNWSPTPFTQLYGR